MSNKVEEKKKMSAAKRTLKPRLRFPEFQGAGEWENRELHELATIINEKAGLNKFTLMSISAGIGLVSQIEKFGREIAGAQYKNYFVIRKNDFAYNKSATKEYPEGYIAMYSGEDLAAVPNSIFTCFRVDDGNVSPLYLNYLFLGNLHGKWLRKYITVGARAHGSLNIDNKDLLSVPVPLPLGESSLNEQQKIADCLSSLDELLTAQAQKLDALKAHKKGLMQQLFPAEGETLPNLRFSEFRGAEEWEEKKLGSLVEIFSGDAPSSHKLSRTHGCPYVKVEDMNNCSKYQSTSREYAEKSPKNLPIGSVIFPKRGAAIMGNKVRIAAVPFYIDSNMMALFPHKTSSLSSEFLYYLIVTQQLSKIADTSSIPQINNKHIIAYTVAIPSPPEQQKIADCLSSLDELLTAQAQKLDALKAHKKGLMQQLFPALDKVQG